MKLTQIAVATAAAALVSTAGAASPVKPQPAPHLPPLHFGWL